MGRPLKILMAEDNLADAELILRHLRKAGFDPDCLRVDNARDFERALNTMPEVILCDYGMPGFTGVQALEMVQAGGWNIPFLLISGTIGEETAVQAMQLGALDYLLKDRLTRLGPAVTRALEQGRLRQEREAAMASLGLFRTLVDQSSDAFEVMDLDTGRFLDVNESGCRELGYSRDEVQRLTVGDIDPNATAANWAEFAQKLRKEGRASGEGVHRRKDGTSFPIEFNARLVQLDRDYLVSVVRNIADRLRREADLRASEERLRIVTDNARIGLVMVNAEHRYVFANPTYAEILGLPAGDLIGRRVADVLGPFYELQVRPRLEEAFRGARVAYEMSRPAPDGTHHYAVRYEPTWENGQLALVVKVIMDISERKRAEQALHERLDELQRWHAVTLGREERILELKAEVNALLQRLGESRRYGEEQA